MKNKTAAYRGITEMLERLSKENYKMAILSNKFDKAVKDLSQTYFSEYIKIAMGEQDTVSKKPAPDIVFHALEALGSSTHTAVYVGDSEIDVKTAKNSKVLCVGVTWGFRGRAVLEREGADYIINEPQELLKIISC
jgi:phosphoglycolate phosphatase